MDKIIPSFRKSLFDSSKEAIGDITELGIDSLLDVGIFKDLPVVSLLIGVKKTAQNLHDRNLLKLTLNFIKEFNSGTIDDKKLNQYRQEISSDDKKAESELGRVLIILNSTIELEKSSMLANLFRNYVNGSINWLEFCEFSEIVRMLFINDLEDLNKFYSGKIKETKECSIISVNRLKSLGLIDTSEKRNGFSIPMDQGYSLVNSHIVLTKIGGKFYQAILLN